MSTCYDIVKPNLLFVYGILKRGYELDLTEHGARFVSKAHIPNAALYGIGRRWDHESHPNESREYSGVGLRLNIGPLWVAHGELFEIPDNLWDWLDGIENNGHTYERKVVRVELNRAMEGDRADAWVYEHMHPFEKHDREIPIEGGIF